MSFKQIKAKQIKARDKKLDKETKRNNQKNYVTYIAYQKLGNKRQQVASYLIYKVSLAPHKITYSPTKLAKRYHCSLSSVSQAIHFLKQISFYHFKHHTMTMTPHKGDDRK